MRNDLDVIYDYIDKNGLTFNSSNLAYLSNKDLEDPITLIEAKNLDCSQSYIDISELGDDNLYSKDIMQKSLNTYNEHTYNSLSNNEMFFLLLNRVGHRNIKSMLDNAYYMELG